MEGRIRTKLAEIDENIARLNIKHRNYALLSDPYNTFLAKVCEKNISLYENHKHAIINRTDDMEMLLRVKTYLPGRVIVVECQ